MGFVALVVLMDLCQRSGWHSDRGAEQQRQRQKRCAEGLVMTSHDGLNLFPVPFSCNVAARWER